MVIVNEETTWDRLVNRNPWSWDLGSDWCDQVDRPFSEMRKCYVERLDGLDGCKFCCRRRRAVHEVLCNKPRDRCLHDHFVSCALYSGSARLKGQAPWLLANGKPCRWQTMLRASCIDTSRGQTVMRDVYERFSIADPMLYAAMSVGKR